MKEENLFHRLYRVLDVINLIIVSEKALKALRPTYEIRKGISYVILWELGFLQLSLNKNLEVVNYIYARSY